MTVVMGLDQHRGRVTAEWIDTETGEVSRARVSPAHREPVRRFLSRFRDRELEVALEATTGWRFVGLELRAVGAGVHLAEPAETAARRGNKKRAKSDRADARHLRELLMVARLPESWIPRTICWSCARGSGSATRWSISAASGSNGSTRCSTTTGFPPTGGLVSGEGRAWLVKAALPTVAREQIVVALKMIDALDVQLAPIDRELRAYARRQVGCKALMRHYGIGELTAVTILAELGDARRFSSSRDAVRYGGMDVTV